MQRVSARERQTSISRAFDERQALHVLGMSTAYATEAAFVKELGKLETADIARATGADKTSVRAWVRGNRSPSGVYGERLAELSGLVERLAHVLHVSARWWRHIPAGGDVYYEPPDPADNRWQRGPSTAPSCGMGAGRSQVQILSPRLEVAGSMRVSGVR